MIAAATFPTLAGALRGYIVSDQRSGATFDPVSGFWLPYTGPLAASAWPSLVIYPGRGQFASLLAWPMANYARLWVNVGNVIHGDQLIAIPFGFLPTGVPYQTAGMPVALGLSASGPVDGDGWSMLPYPGVGPSEPIPPA